MAPKLLSLIIIAASCHHFIGAMFTARPLAVSQVDTQAGRMQQVQELLGFKHSDRLAPFNTPRLLGPPELPREAKVSRLPHEVFPEGSTLDQVATQQLDWVKNKNYNLLSVDTKSEWEGIGQIYSKLEPKERVQVRRYMEQYATRGSLEHQIDLIRVERSMRRVNYEMWWKADLVTKAKREIGEDMDLTQIGDILQFKNPAQKLTQADVPKIVDRLDGVFGSLVTKAKREQPLNLQLLNQASTNIHGKQFLFDERMTELKKALPTLLTEMSPEKKAQVSRVLQQAQGLSPQKARQLPRKLDSAQLEKLLS